MFVKYFKEFKALIGIILLAILLLAIFFGGLIGYSKYYEKAEALMILSKDLTTAENLNKVNKKKLKELNKEYEDILVKYNHIVTAYSELLAENTVISQKISNLEEIISTLPSSDNSSIVNGSVPCNEAGECTSDICLGLFKGEKVGTTFEDLRLKITVNFTRIDKLKWEAELLYDLHQLFKLKLIETTDKSDGSKNLHAALFEVDKDGNILNQLTIKEFEFINQNNFKKGMNWWSPSFFLGIHQPVFSQSTWSPIGVIGFSFSKYSFAKDKFPSIQLFQFSVGVNSEPDLFFYFSPASYNLGRNIPLIKDLWIGLDFGLNTKTNFSLGLSLSTNL